MTQKQRSHSKLLFTPGPLNTQRAVRDAMLVDMGSRDEVFIKVVAQVRAKLLKLVDKENSAGFSVVPMQGSGTFAVESAISSLIPKHAKILVLINGAYGERIFTMAQKMGREVAAIRSSETAPISAEGLRQYLNTCPEVEFVVLVHCETTTGVINPLEEVAKVVSEAGRSLVVDAMSSFGGVEIDLNQCPVDVLIASSNKCLEGVPGLGFVIAKLDLLERSKGNCASMSLDLHDQWNGLEMAGQFRFTPPTHAILALNAALDLLENEGGVTARNLRYRANHKVLMAGMKSLGFKPVVAAKFQSPIISTFYIPEDPKFDFNEFYQLLADQGLVIYPGKLSLTECFRVGSIGDLRSVDLEILLEAMGCVLKSMGVALGGKK